MIPKIQFFTTDRMNDFFGNLGSLMYMVMPILVVSVAASLVGYFIVVIRNVFSQSRDRDYSREEDYDYDDD